MINKILKYPNPILRKKSEKVKEITNEIKNLIKEMKKIITIHQGVGLAASQFGVLKRIILIQMKKALKVFINPKIIKKSKETIIREEGCLNFPGLFLEIKRAKKIEVESLDENKKKIFLKVEGLLARIFQHEIDHLDGILFIDRINFWQKWKIRKKLKEFKTQYGSY